MCARAYVLFLLVYMSLSGIWCEFEMSNAHLLHSPSGTPGVQRIHQSEFELTDGTHIFKRHYKAISSTVVSEKKTFRAGELNYIIQFNSQSELTPVKSFRRGAKVLSRYRTKFHWRLLNMQLR